MRSRLFKLEEQKDFLSRPPRIGKEDRNWNRGELTRYQNRLFFDGTAVNGIFNHEGVRRILEKERLDPKSAGKSAWALTQFGLWYEIYMKLNPEYL